MARRLKLRKTKNKKSWVQFPGTAFVCMGLFSPPITPHSTHAGLKVVEESEKRNNKEKIRMKKTTSKETESTVYLQMDKILEGMGIKQLTNPVSPAVVERFKRAVLAKIDDNTDTVVMVGRMPEAMAMVVAAALAQRVTRFEYGGYCQVSHVIFDYSDSTCPEMRI